jgi:SAM-dependent methyltransferase
MFCNVCNSEVFFDLYNNWPRDFTRCPICNSLVRERALKYIMDNKILINDSSIIHESSPSGALHNYFLKKYKNYTYSYYFNNISNGEFNNDGIQCVDLNKIPFNDNTFDLFITLDVFEHLFTPEIAIKEIYRVLKPGGSYIMTVPVENENEKTEKTCYINDNNEIIHIQTKKSIEKNVLLEYHGNPIDNSGSIVTYYYGYDIINMIEKNTNFKVELFLKDDELLHHAVLGKYKDVFLCTK